MKRDRVEGHHDEANPLEARYSRRTLLTWAGSLAAISMLPACRQPEERIFPSVTTPEAVIPGNALHYATAIALMGNAFGLLVETHEGRPTKIEGNPRHPEALGASSSFLQASIMQLYDDDRSQGATFRGQPRTWADARAMLAHSVATFKRDHGASFALVTRDHRSPTLASLVIELKKTLPDAQLFCYEPFDRSAIQAGCAAVFERTVQPTYDFAESDVVVAFDADPLGLEGSPLRAAHEWASRRAPEHGSMNRWYVVESSLTVTGSVADHRLICADARVQAALCTLSIELQQLGAIELGESLTHLVEACANTLQDASVRAQLRVVAGDLAAHRGRSLVVVGARQPKALHALAQLLNDALSNQGSTVKYVPCFDGGTHGISALQHLAEGIVSGSIQHVLTLDCNPVYDSPRELELAQRIGRLQTSIHVGLYRDETALASQWHINLAHAFESWGDAVSEDGTASIVQPMIAPLFNGHTTIDVLLDMLARNQSTHDAVRAFWQQKLGATDFDHAWRRALHDGVVAGTASATVAVVGKPDRVAANLAGARSPLPSGYELSFTLDAHVYDGRYANNTWLYELPEPFTKLTWGNAARISAAIAQKYGLSDGDMLTLGIGEHRVHVPVVVTPGQAQNTITLTVGHGRTVWGHAAAGIGYDAQLLRLTENPFYSHCDFIQRYPGRFALARTQEQFSMLGRAPVQTAVISQLAALTTKNPVQRSVFAQRATRAWAMNIDLSKCIGCNACVVACHAENNIAVVGVNGVRRGRHMHWMRIDRYFAGDGVALRTWSQPIVCQQCEKAPCETVCPAGATSHSPDGLNDMTYNRCVGSRYCANNCPFKVRKFNYFEYWGSVPATRRMQLNPDVTVRSRGVMEKCTFCVQRINAAKIDAMRNGTGHIADGSVSPACQQACPTGAIVFGDWADASSRVAAAIQSPRVYRLLDELSLEPRVFYQSNVRNPNPEFKS